jgi:hypothetical protein
LKASRDVGAGRVGVTGGGPHVALINVNADAALGFVSLIADAGRQTGVPVVIIAIIAHLVGLPGSVTAGPGFCLTVGGAIITLGEVAVIAGLVDLQGAVTARAGEGLAIPRTIIRAQSVAIVAHLIALLEGVPAGAGDSLAVGGAIIIGVHVAVIAAFIFLSGGVTAGTGGAFAIGRAIIPSSGVAIVARLPCLRAEEAVTTGAKVVSAGPRAIIAVDAVAVIAGFAGVHHAVPASREGAVEPAGARGDVGIL